MDLSILPLTIEDQLILSTLSYANFAAVMNKRETVSLEEATERLLNIPYAVKNFRIKTDYDLVEAINNAPRFASLLLSDVEDHFDAGKRQFFAMTLHLPLDTKMIIFRGTDNTVTGWKEDLEMAYEDEVPSQSDALNYLNHIASKYEGPLILAGHSKGGNLAIYSAANAHQSIQMRIKAIYNNDGPGFNEQSHTHEKIPQIENKIITIVPESSMIGVIMEHTKEHFVVASSASSIMQHDPYSWLFDGPHFQYVESRSPDSILFETVIASWLERVTREERMIFVDAAYKCFAATGEELRINAFEFLSRTPGVIRSFSNLSSQEKDVMRKMLRKLVKAAKENINTKNAMTQR